MDRNIEGLTESQILSIPLDQPERLFDQDRIADQFKILAKRWHPDLNGNHRVFAHIALLRKAAVDHVVAGRWTIPNVEMITTKAGKTFRFSYLAAHDFELGRLFVGHRVVMFRIDKQYRDLFQNGVRQIGSVRFPDNRMKDQHERFLPRVEKTLETDRHLICVVSKTEDVVLLRDLLHHCRSLPARHVAWVVSSLLNILCFYEITGRTHNGLSVDTVFCSPKDHTAFPLGGWWYSQPAGSKITALPPSVHALASPKMLKDKIASPSLDLASLRAIARRCLSDGLIIPPDTPAPMARFLRLPGSTSAIKDYEEWGRVLDESLGARRFIKLSVSPSDIYA